MQHTLKVQMAPITENLHYLTRKLQNRFLFFEEISNAQIMTVNIVIFLFCSYFLDYPNNLSRAYNA